MKDSEIFAKMLDRAAIDHAVQESAGNAEVKWVELTNDYGEMAQFFFDASGHLCSVEVNELPVRGA